MLENGAEWTQGAYCGERSSESKEGIDGFLPAVWRCSSLLMESLGLHQRAWLCSSVPEIDVITLLQKRYQPLGRATVKCFRE